MWPLHMCKLSRCMVWGIQWSRERRRSLHTHFLFLLEILQNPDRGVGLLVKEGCLTWRPLRLHSSGLFLKQVTGIHHTLASANKRELAASCTEKKKKSRYKQGLQEWLDPGVHCHQDMLFLSLHLIVLISLLGLSFLVRLPFYGGYSKLPF